MDEFQLGKDIGQLSTRISLLESRVGGEDIFLEKGRVDDDFIGIDGIFVLDGGGLPTPGNCDAKFKAGWRNKKVVYNVCAKSETEARDAGPTTKKQRKNNKMGETEKAITKLVKAAANFDCEKRKCSGAKCETVVEQKNALIGGLTCVETKPVVKCKKADETEWTCTGWYSISARVTCGCKKPKLKRS